MASWWATPRPPDDAARRHRHEHGDPDAVRHRVEARLGGTRLGRARCCRATRRNGVPSGCTTWSGPARPTAPVAAPRTLPPWDLNGRLTHHWVRRGDETVSTLDLLGEGVTALAGPGRAAPIPRMRAPMVTHVLDESTASALAIATGGALVLRPDGQALDGHPAVDGELGSRGEAGTR